MKNCPELGRRLQEERKAHGFNNRATFAHSVAKSDRTITNWESGISYPDASDLLRLADLGFDVGYILFGVRQTMVVNEEFAKYRTPAASLGAEIGGLALSSKDTDLLLEMAKRLAGS